MPESIDDSSAPVVSPAERYERGLALKKAGQHKAAIAQLEMAVADPTLALKAYAQIGLCSKAIGRLEDAVAAFRHALSAPGGSPRETVQILYVLGRTLESLERVGETLEAYRWIRREEPDYRDVADRIERLSARRPTSMGKQRSPDALQGAGSILRSWNDLFGISK
ncbi:MAG: tetratricopeptide repeat protein [Nitrospira sp.]|nr:tetratricopeptide repeat protein [Nitrospira sp.]